MATARDVYRDIGREVLGRGRSAWDERAYVRGRRKIALALRAGVETFTTAHRQRGSSRDGLWKRPRT